MINKPDIWTVIGLIWIALLVMYQIADYIGFRTAGSRFTASDGQALCERVQRLEIQPKPCTYSTED